MYQEINNISLETGAYCQGLLEYLTKCLQNSSCNVKLKTLRIMKYVVLNGHPEFRQGLRQNAHGIQHATGYSGTPDPLHGMAPYMMVRKQAQEVSQMLFEVSQDDTIVPEQKSTNLQSIGGMGSSQSGKMQGFGNQPARSKGLGESIMDSIVEIADKVLDPNPLPVPSLSTENKFGDYKPINVPDVEPLPSHTMSQSQTINPMSMVTSASFTQSLMTQSSLRKSKGHTRGVPGGGWADEDEVEDHGSSRFEDSIADDGEPSLADRLDNIKVEEWLAEREVVSNFMLNCTEDLPTNNEILAMIKGCSVLNFEKVVDIIGENMKLDNTTDSQKLGIMLVIESLLRGDTVSIDFIALSLHLSLKYLFSTCKGPVQQKARKVIRILEALSTKSELFEETRLGLKPAQPSKPSVDITNVSSRSLLEDEQSPQELQFLNVPFGNQSLSDSSLGEDSKANSQSTFSFLNS